MHSLTPAAKAAGETKTLIAALKRCATRNHGHRQIFQAPL